MTQIRKPLLPHLLDGQTILITGGGSGLGREMATAFAGMGARCIIAGRRQPMLDATVAEIAELFPDAAPVTAHICDIKHPEQVAALVEAIWTGAGPLTGLVNNAAGNFISPTKDLSPNGFRAIADTVFNGTFYLTQEVGKRWIADGPQPFPRSVLSILVTWVRNGSPFTVPSAMSKAGIRAMTESLAVEWAPWNIRLNAIAPGLFPTEGATKRLHPGEDRSADEAALETIPMGRYGQMNELAAMAAFTLSPLCAYLTGETIAVDGGRYLATGANFYGLRHLTDDDWAERRAAIKAINAADRDLRNG